MKPKPNITGLDEQQRRERILAAVADFMGGGGKRPARTKKRTNFVAKQRVLWSSESRKQ